MGLLKLAVVDFGVGIPATVREFFKNDPRAKRFSAVACLKWAFQPGTSTKADDGTGRGIGLDILKEFVHVNRGRLAIYSEDGYALIGHQKEQYGKRPTFFKGTAVNITLRCDETFYRLAEQVPAKARF